jgi:DNA-binding transcriptional ArsR family regulator/uncharacterized protein YndB with AHSA1/START domain
MDEVFRALHDPHRRLLLDRLFDHDGQTLLELSAIFPEMTRYGVMSHLRVLEEAGLIVTKKVGRHKHHYLNPVPIRLINDRWISKYTAPWIGALVDLKSQLEKGVPAMSGPVHVYQVFVGCRVDEAWRALTDGDLTERYYYGTRVSSDWKPGSTVLYTYPDGSVAADGEVLFVEAPNRLELSFHPRWDPEMEKAGPVRMVWLVEELNDAVRIAVELYDIEPGSRIHDEFSGGIAFIVSGLKTLLETGRPLAATG